MSSASAFGTRLRALRLERGLTLQQLAERSGMHLQGLAKIESGQRSHPAWDTVCSLAEAMGVPTDAFRDTDDDRGDDAPEYPPDDPPRGKRK